MEDSVRNSDQRLMTPREVEAEFGLTIDRLSRWRTSGEGPRWIKFDATSKTAGVFYRRSDILQFIEAHEQTQTAPHSR